MSQPNPDRGLVVRAGPVAVDAQGTIRVEDRSEQRQPGADVSS